MRSLHLNCLIFEMGRIIPRTWAAGRVKQDRNCESTWPKAQPLGGPLTRWFKKHPSTSESVGITEHRCCLFCPPSSPVRDQTFVREDKRFKELKTELQ